ncbi:MAG: hypothetical protein IPG89_09660 [Bacteroidetes bacterium]|nr:hypothetical protein [Bacteroidota bacterium]
MSKKIETTISRIDLLSNDTYKSFLKVQSTYSIAQTGGSYAYYNNSKEQVRLVSDVNILDSTETKRIIFSNLLGKN